MNEKLALVVAISRGGVIGRDGALPWHLPEDLSHFRRVTTGHAIIMGRSTYDSIGRPLPRRRSIVLSRQRDLHIEGCEMAASLDEALALARTEDDEPRIIGGASVYAEALPRATRIFLSEVHQDVDGDTLFPAFDRAAWREDQRREGDGVTFLTLVRRS